MTAADLRSDETKAGDYRVHRAVAAERERCAKIVDSALRAALSGNRIGASNDCLAAIALEIRNATK